jgi:hypothetical protein
MIIVAFSIRVLEAAMVVKYLYNQWIRMKTCNRCSIEKADSDFTRKKHRSGNYGLAAYCKACSNELSKARRSNYTEEKREAIRVRMREYRNTKGRDVVLECKRRGRLKKKAIKLSSAVFDAHVQAYFKYIDVKHDAHVTRWMRTNNGAIYARWKTKHIPEYMLYHRMKRWMHKHYPDFPPVNTILKELGYTLTDLKEHIESQFVDGMNWENTYWTIDHIIPIAMFPPVSSPEEQAFKDCHALHNLQPLSKGDNMKKRSHIALQISNHGGVEIAGVKVEDLRNA